MGDYGPTGTLVQRLIDRASVLTGEESADLFRARSARALISGAEAERLALARARRAAVLTGRMSEFVHAREGAAAAFRHSRRGSGPWLTVTGAVANAAGALVVEDELEAKAFDILFGPWQQALGRLTPVGPGYSLADRSPAARPSRRA